MGKSAKGALWLDANKTSPYDFYQYFRNVEDVKVEECFRLLTFLEMDEIKEICKYQDERINEAKKRLAFEVTKLVHGEEEAIKAQKQAEGAFSNDIDSMPAVNVAGDMSMLVVDMMVLAKVATTKSEARRLVEGGGVKINDTKISAVTTLLSEVVDKNEFVLHKGKKVHVKVVVG